MSVAVVELDGKGFFYGFLAGSGSILKHTRELNEINVFPVADADTGTNLASTVHAVLARARPDSSFRVMAAELAEAALDGARGNSGIIFAQFISGFARVLPEDRVIDVRRFAKLAGQAARAAREAVAEPVEGTILTVMDDWARVLDSLKEETADFADLLSRSYRDAARSLRETTARLPALARAGVVDAGAKGFVLFLEGILELIWNRNLRSILRGHRISVAQPLPREAAREESLTHRYCSETLLEGESLDPAAIREAVRAEGDSVVVAGTRRKVRVHVHTDDPVRLSARLESCGTVGLVKVVDMVRRHEAAHRRAFDIALLTDSGCDLPPELIDQYGIHVVPLNVRVGRHQYLDRLTITPERLYRALDVADAPPATSQPSEKAFADAYAILLAHYRSVMALHLNAAFSGTWFNSSRAAEVANRDCGRTVDVIDSKTLSGGLGLIMLRAAQNLERGIGHGELVRRVGEWVNKTGILVAVPTLRYMVRSGRVSPMKGLLANLLHLKPILSLGSEGKIRVIEKSFTRRGGVKRIVRRVTEKASGGLWGYCVLHAHDPAAAARLGGALHEALGRPPAFTMEISTAIGIHVGPGCVAVAWLLE